MKRIVLYFLLFAGKSFAHRMADFYCFGPAIGIGIGVDTPLSKACGENASVLHLKTDFGAYLSGRGVCD